MENEIKNTRLVQIKDRLHCDFVEYVPSELLDETKQIYITNEDRLAIGETKCFDIENNCVIDYDNSNEVARQEKQARIAELKVLLTSTDYKAIKFAEGAITKTEYAETKALRQSYRDEINQLESELI